MTVINKNKGTQVGLLLGYYLTLSFWSAQTLTLSMVSRNIAGQTKKSAVVAATFIAWAAGNAVGECIHYLFFSWERKKRSWLLIHFTVRSASLPGQGRSSVLYCLQCTSRVLHGHALWNFLASMVAEEGESEERCSPSDRDARGR
jgi:hypothetical protein